jgi:predicted nucleic acid-binding protein
MRRVSGVVVDTSVWIDFFAGRPVPSLEDALAQGSVILSPLIVAELVSGARRSRDRDSIRDLMRELPLHETPLDHWVRVGDLRRQLHGRGLAVSTPDAHVAQCALDRDALLLSRDAVFQRIAAIGALRLQSS